MDQVKKNIKMNLEQQLMKSRWRQDEITIMIQK